MEVVKIRGSYRVIDDNGNYARYTEEEYNALFGVQPADAVEEKEVEEVEQKALPFTDPYSPTDG